MPRWLLPARGLLICDFWCIIFFIFRNRLQLLLAVINTFTFICERMFIFMAARKWRFLIWMIIFRDWRGVASVSAARLCEPPHLKVLDSAWASNVPAACQNPRWNVHHALTSLPQSPFGRVHKYRLSLDWQRRDIAYANSLKSARPLSRSSRKGLFP